VLNQEVRAGMKLSFYRPGGGCVAGNWYDNKIIRQVRAGVDQFEFKRSVPHAQLGFSTLRQHANTPRPEPSLLHGDFRYPVLLHDTPFSIPREHSVQLNDAHETIVLGSCWYWVHVHSCFINSIVRSHVCDVVCCHLMLCVCVE
jgi:hypothetical protein